MGPIVSMRSAGFSGAMSPDRIESGDEIFVAKGKKAPVVMTGYLGGPRIKGDDGKYHVADFGRLSLRAAMVGTGAAQRYVFEIAGGLHGVLFANPKVGESPKQPDYRGNIDLGDGTEIGFFGRKLDGTDGPFVGLSTTARAEPRRQKGQVVTSTSAQAAAAPASQQGPAGTTDPFGDPDEGCPF